jgi:hypothetical protein
MHIFESSVCLQLKEFNKQKYQVKTVESENNFNEDDKVYTAGYAHC